ncbi:thiamine pyrophosphate-dependent dehydrogenase E1 component subunit alpha [Streptomyces sp. NPDC048312]|uniref:Dehydrogenase n=1 Tax=Streptomyces melanovinaceus TaxID=1182637 RepID=I3QDM1_9ACTN|nr:QncN [Streptomyces melanovinaceus]AGD95042.1 dehydrogenase [Streptomyces melanovinaceus]BAO84856.1 putative dehydrogenase alpha subunit [Streptomyces melanovinaceus]
MAAPTHGPTALAETSDDDLEALLMIRHFELALLDLFSTGKLNGTTHTCLGQEYIPVALAPLTEGDFVFSNHRGHGHYLARFHDPAGLLAEIMGRDGAVCRGVGGSQHIYRDGFLSTGIQGQSLPVAVGVALHLKRAGDHRIAVAYTGDGTWGEGAVYEALNMAQLWRVPLLVVVEHNGIAQSTPTHRQMAGTIADRARAFGIPHVELGGVGVDALRAELAPRVDEMRTRQTPLVIQFNTARVGPHSKGDDTRSAPELRLAGGRDWYPAYAAALGARFEAVDAKQRDHIAELVHRVEARPPSTWHHDDTGGATAA